MISTNDILNVWIPYRLEAIKTMREAFRLRDIYGSHADAKVFFDDELSMTGSTALFINPMIEAGAIHARALMEFMGITINKQNKLCEIARTRRDDDIAIEHYDDLNGNTLEKLTLNKIYKNYPGSHSDVKKAFCYLLTSANKDLAHITQGTNTSGDVDIALRGIPVLIESNLYIPLGRSLSNHLFE